MTGAHEAHKPTLDEAAVVPSDLQEALLTAEHPFDVDWRVPALELSPSDRLLRLARVKALLPSGSALHEKTSHDATLENYMRLALDAAGDRSTLDTFLGYVQQTLEGDGDLEGRQLLAQQVFWIWLPIATIADLREHKADLGDTALKVLLPDEYAALDADFAAIEENGDALLDQTRQDIEDIVESLELKKESFRVELSDRKKTKYSAWRKKHKEDRTETEIFDLLGFRIIVYGPDEKRTIGQCRYLMAEIEKYFEPEDRLKDYIDQPKGNGYRGLHQTFRLPGGQSFELQVRTYNMHKHASGGTGVAHHGYDATYKAVPGKIRRPFQKVPRLYRWRDEATLRITAADGRIENILGDDVLFFRSDGNLYKMPAGMTALDASFHIHSRRALKTKLIFRGDKPIRFTDGIRHGDVLDVAYRSEYPTSPIRLRNMLKTTESKYAHTAVEKSLRRLSAPAMQHAGNLVLESLMRKLPLNDPLSLLSDEDKQQLAHDAGQPDFDKLLQVIGNGQKGTKPTRIVRRVMERAGLEIEEDESEPPQAKALLADDQVLAHLVVPGIHGSVACRVAGCCSGSIRFQQAVWARASRHYPGVLQLHRDDCNNLGENDASYACDWSNQGHAA